MINPVGKSLLVGVVKSGDVGEVVVKTAVVLLVGLLVVVVSIAVIDSNIAVEVFVVASA